MLGMRAYAVCDRLPKHGLMSTSLATLKRHADVSNAQKHDCAVSSKDISLHLLQQAPPQMGMT